MNNKKRIKPTLTQEQINSQLIKIYTSVEHANLLSRKVVEVLKFAILIDPNTGFFMYTKGEIAMITSISRERVGQILNKFPQLQRTTRTFVHKKTKKPTGRPKGSKDSYKRTVVKI